MAESKSVRSVSAVKKLLSEYEKHEMLNEFCSISVFQLIEYIVRGIDNDEALKRAAENIHDGSDEMKTSKIDHNNVTADMKANIMATTRETETDDGLRFEIVSVRSEVRAANLRSSFTSANPVHNYAGAVLSRVFNEHFDEILVVLYPAIQQIHENVIKEVIGRVLRNIDAREIIVP